MKKLSIRVIALICVTLLCLATVCSVAPAAASTVYLRGTFNGWENPADYAVEVNAAKSGLKAALAAEMKKGLEIRPVKGNVLRLVAKDGSGFFDLSDTEIASLLKPFLGEMKI